MSRQQMTDEQEQQMETSKGVYKAIAEVMSDLAKEGISKDHRNEQQKYKFRGIDDAYNALAPVLSKRGLVILPRIISRECSEKASKNGGVLFYVVVEAEFDVVCSTDGSLHTVRTFGEAMDSADKATNKAMSAAYKYMAFQTFCIPTQGDNDADATTHDIAPKQDGLRPGALADLFAMLDEATNKEDLRDRLKNARSICFQGGDMEAKEKVDAYAADLAKHKFKEAA